MKSIFCKFAFLSFTFFFVSCASVQLASHSSDSDAKEFHVPSGQAKIYIMRRNAMLGAALLFDIGLDGQRKGSLAPGSYRVFTVPAGEHRVSVISQENEDVEKFTAKTGGIYFFDVKSRAGWFASRASVEGVSDSTGKEWLKDCRLAN